MVWSTLRHTGYSASPVVQMIENREVSLTLGIVVEKRKSSHAWADWVWKPVSVLMNPPAGKNWEVLRISNDVTQYHAGIVHLVLHRKDTEALRENLMLPEPELYVVLREPADPDEEFPYEPHSVTASAFDAQDSTDAGDDLVEKVPMPEAVAAFIQAFVEQHHIDEEFIKRKRDRLKLEEQKFGKNPIFESPTRH